MGQKNATIRYRVLDRCFSNPGRKFYIQDLLDACNDALLEDDPKSKGIQKRQLYDDIRFMESEQGYNIPLEKIKEGRKTYYRYYEKDFSITSQPINENEAQQLKSAMQVLRRFKGMPQFDWINEMMPKLDQTFRLSDQSEEIVSFENNEFVKGTEFIEKLFQAILYRQPLKITYKSFKRDEPSEINFHPYLLKQYNNRWYLFGRSEGYDKISNLALDRIVSAEDSGIGFIENDLMDMEEYFEDIIGVTRNEGEAVKIILQADGQLSSSYIKTKPLHGSQTKISEDENGYRFSIEVIPNYELEKLILSFGEQLTVLEPEEFREKIKNRILNISKIYN